MGRGSRTANYAIGTATSTAAISNMYIYGGSLWALFYFFTGLADAGTVSQAVTIMMDVYVMKLFAWPWDQIILADTLPGLIRSHVQTWGVGWLVATAKYGINS